MLKISIPGQGDLVLKHLVADFSGTLSVDGQLQAEVLSRLNQISRTLNVHILTADTHGKACQALQGVNADVSLLPGETHTEAKENYVMDLGAGQVIAFGNGNNDSRMLATAAIGVVVCLAEGCAVSALTAADIVVTSITDGLDLLLHPNRLVATLRK